MALHRDILWIGRQWAVTGHGMQLIDQRLEGAFDIEVIRLWDDDLIASLRAKEWLKAADFDKGLAVARTRYPRGIGAGSCDSSSRRRLRREAGADRAAELPSHASDQPTGGREPAAATVEPPKQELPDLQMKIDGGAKFARPWRVWMKKT